MIRWTAVLILCACFCLFAGSYQHSRSAPGLTSEVSVKESDPLRRGLTNPAFPASGSLSSSTVTTRLSVPAGATVVLGSLDRTGLTHEVTLSWSDTRLTSTAGKPDSGPGDCDIRRLSQSELNRILGFAHRETIGRSGEHHLSQIVPERTPATEAADSGRLTVSSRRFRVPWFSGSSVLERFVEADEVACGRRLRVFAEQNNSISGVDSRTLSALTDLVIRTAEDEILQIVESRVGPVEDVDEDGRLTVLLCGLSDRMSFPPDTEPVHGCVRAGDFSIAPGAFGGDIIYLDDRIPTGQLRALLAHELTHAAVFSVVRHSGRVVPGWLNEAIAHMVELEVDPGSRNLTQRFADFRRRSHVYPVVIPDSVSQPGARRGGTRAAGCSFLTFALSAHPDCQLRQLLTEPAEGSAAVESVTGTDFDELFRNWTLSLLQSDFPASSYRPTEEARIPLSGTSFLRLQPSARSGRMILTWNRAAQLQVTIVEADEEGVTGG